MRIDKKWFLLIIIFVGASFASAGLNVSFGANTDSGTLYRGNIFVNASSQGDTNISTFINLDNSLAAWWRMDEAGRELLIDGGAESGGLSNWTSLSGVTADAYAGPYAFFRVGPNTGTSNALMPIDNNSVYNLSGYFKSNGTGGTSRLYFGYVPYDINQVQINYQNIGAVLSTDTTLYEAASSGSKTVKVVSGLNWYVLSYGFMAFNTDDSGNYTDLPNRNLSNMGIENVTNRGSYWEINFTTTVGVNAAAGTKVRMHTAGGSYMYTAAVNSVVSNTSWTNFNATTTGVSIRGETAGKWWPGTKYAKIMMLLNYGQDNSYTTLFDNISLIGPDVYDYSSNDNNGYANGTAIQTLSGKFGKGYSFDRGGSYISVPNSASLNITNNFTVSAWIYQKDSVEASNGIVTKTGSGGYQMFTYTNFPYFYVYNSTGGACGAYKYTSLGLNTWRHVVGVYNGTDASIYVDGSFWTTTSCGAGFVFSSTTSNLEIGKNGGSYFNGTLDDIMIFNRSLNVAEIQALYANTSSKSLAVNFSIGSGAGNHSFKVYSQDLNAVVNNTSIGTVDIRESRISLERVYPTSNIFVPKGFFNVSVNVTCLDRDCGDINVSLDPIQGSGYTVSGSNYTAYNSSEPGEPVYQWEEIISNSIGTAIWNGGNIDDSYYNLSLPFNFSFYGVNYTTASLSSNGRVHFTTVSASSTSVALPVAGVVTAAIFNRDMYVSTTQGKVYYANLTNPNRVVIQHNNIDYCCSVGASNFTYEIVLYQDGRIKYLYKPNNPSFTGGQQNGLNFNLTAYLLLGASSPDQYRGMAVTFYPAGYPRSLKSGLVNTTFGATPFYTNATSNPLTINLNASQSQVVTFFVNATGNDSVYEFFVYVNKTSNMVTSNITTHWNVTIDSTGPLLTNVSYSPNVSNDIDPETEITFDVAVADANVSISQVILQYSNGTAWANSTMTSVGGNVYSTSFLTDPTEMNYTFNVLSYDILENFNVTRDYNFSSYWDCTWNISSGGLSGAEAMGSFEDKVIGNITIINNGDSVYPNNNCTLSFSGDFNRNGFSESYWTTSNWFSGSRGLSIPSAVVSAGTNETVEITASFPGIEGSLEENPTIAITSDLWDSIYSRNNRTVTAAITVAKPGPYLRQSIITSSSAVYLTSQNLSFVSYLENIGGDGTDNNSAYNVSYNWTFPSSLALNASSGVLFFDNISNNSLVYNNLSLELNETTLPGLTQGVYTLYSYAFGYNVTGGLMGYSGNRTLLSNSINLTLLCYNQNDGICVSSCGYTTDPDCPVPSTKTSGSGSGGGGGGDGGTRENSDALFELLRGKAQQFVLPITNKLSMAKTDIEISVMGPNAEYIKLLTTSIARLEPNSTQDVIVEITAPAYFSKGEYVLYFTIQGKVEGGSTFYERKKVTLFIVEVSRTAADQALASSIKMVGEMNRSGMRTDKVSKLLSEMNAFYTDYNFEGVQKNFESLSKIYKAAFDAKALLEELRAGIAESEKNGVEVIETKKILYVGENAYNRGDYVLAVERLNEAKLSYALETKGEFSIYHTIKNNPVQSVGILVSALIVGLGSTTLIRFRLLKRKLKMLEDEEKLLLELMKVVQREAFEKNSMSMEEYQQAMGQYENKLSQTIEEKITVEAKLLYMFKARGRKARYGDERKRLMELIGDLQDRYMNKGTIETRIYGNMLKSYTARLSEIDETLAFLEAKKAIKAGGFIGGRK